MSSALKPREGCRGETSTLSRGSRAISCWGLWSACLGRGPLSLDLGRALQIPGSWRRLHFLLQNQSLLGVKRKLESDVQRISYEHEELISEFRSANERAKKATTDLSVCAARCDQEGPGHPSPGPRLRTRCPQAGKAASSHHGSLWGPVPALRSPEAFLKSQTQEVKSN